MAIGKAMNRVRCREVGFGFQLIRLDYFVDLRSFWISGVDDVDSAGGDPRQEHEAAVLAGLAVAAAAGVPAEMMQLITNVQHWQTMDHLSESSRGGVGIDRGEVVGLLYIGAAVNCWNIKQCFSRRLHRIGDRRPSPVAAGGFLVLFLAEGVKRRATDRGKSEAGCGGGLEKVATLH